MLEKAATIGKALRIVQSYGGRIGVRIFAQEMWPTSKVWKKPAKLTNAHGFREMGARMHSSAGCFLGRLAARGWVRKAGKGFYEITDSGRRFIEDPLPAPALTPQPPPMSPPGWRLGWVLYSNGVWGPATIGPPWGGGYQVALPDGRLLPHPVPAQFLWLAAEGGPR